MSQAVKVPVGKFKKYCVLCRPQSLTSIVASSTHLESMMILVPHLHYEPCTEHCVHTVAADAPLFVSYQTSHLLCTTACLEPSGVCMNASNLCLIWFLSCISPLKDIHTRHAAFLRLATPRQLNQSVLLMPRAEHCCRSFLNI